MIETLIVIAKRPVAGRVKTRLTPPLTPAAAADVAGAALADTLCAVGATPSSAKVLAFDGDVDGWLLAGWTHVAQPSGGLDDRLAAAFLAAAPGPALLVGMDTPQLQPEQLLAFDPDRYDACLGRAGDGGYWAIGFADPALAPRAILGVPMSTAHTGADQLQALLALGLRVQLLDELTDVDTIADAETVAARAPGTKFAAALAAARAATVARAG